MRVLKGRVRAFRLRQLAIVKWQRKMAGLSSSEWAGAYMTAPAPRLFNPDGTFWLITEHRLALANESDARRLGVIRAVS